MRAALFAHLLLVALLPAPLPALAQDDAPVQLKPGPGRDLVEANCIVCHSLAYIPMNSPFLSAEVWKAEVAKMRTPFGAPIDDADAARIVAYLVAQYGPPQ